MEGFLADFEWFLGTIAEILPRPFAEQKIAVLAAGPLSVLAADLPRAPHRALLRSTSSEIAWLSPASGPSAIVTDLDADFHPSPNTLG